MKKIFIIIMLAAVLAGCGGAPDAQPVGGAALNLQERFAEMFDDEPAAAAGTVRFGENPPDEQHTAPQDITEPELPPATEPPPPAATEPVITAAEATQYVPEPPVITEPLPIVTEPPATTEPPPIVTEPPEELFVVTPSGRRFHVYGCHHARNVHARLTREEAQSRGFDPCRTCNP